MLKLLKFSLLFLLLLAASGAYAQSDTILVRRQSERPESNWKEKITLGGNFGLSFGTITLINFSPLIGYKFTNKFIAGAGPSFIYSRYKYNFSGRSYVYKTTVLGGRIFAQHAIYKNLFARAEYELLNVRYPVTIDQNAREWLSNPLIGGGYSLPIGRRSSFNIMVLYNINYYKSVRNRIIYGDSPWIIRMGFQL